MAFCLWLLKQLAQVSSPFHIGLCATGPGFHPTPLLFNYTLIQRRTLSVVLSYLPQNFRRL